MTKCFTKHFSVKFDSVALCPVIHRRKLLVRPPQMLSYPNISQNLSAALTVKSNCESTTSRDSPKLKIKQVCRLKHFCPAQTVQFLLRGLSYGQRASSQYKLQLTCIIHRIDSYEPPCLSTGLHHIYRRILFVDRTTEGKKSYTYLYFVGKHGHNISKER